MPGIAASAILCFIFSWNDFLFALVIASRRTITLPVAAYGFIGYGEINWGGLTAAAMVITLPALILALFIQKHIVKGLTFGAVKG
jgi:multiple sugar transport system permease protein